jgi:hypothetical protein
VILTNTHLFTHKLILRMVEDYHISIHTRHRGPSSFKPPVQNLSFSTYGPNNQDKALQSTYRRTADDIYIQPLPNGNVIPLKSRRSASSKQDSHLTWAHTFSSPMYVHSPLFCAVCFGAVSCLRLRLKTIDASQAGTPTL